MKILSTIIALTIISSTLAWENIPSIPANHRAQFYLRHDDGGYKYGYDTGDGSAAKQIASADNQVEGFYSVPSDDGHVVNIKYTAGVQGFVPETSFESGVTKSWGSQEVKSSHEGARQSTKHQPWQAVEIVPPVLIKSSDTEPSSDGAYSFSYNTGEHAREESADANGNVIGRFSYTDDAGQHDLSYVAGEGTGFVVTGGSLAVPNGLAGAAGKSSYSKSISHVAQKSWESPSTEGSSDGSYSFSYSTGDHSRSESSDTAGKVRGSYSYTDEAGQHDLSYIAGDDTGFVVTGGSLSQPESGASFQQSSKSIAKVPSTILEPMSRFYVPPAAKSSWETSAPEASSDGSYSYSFNTGQHSKTESSDGSGNVQGRYSYTDEAGEHDLSYTAGDHTGFVVTGGSLAESNGLSGSSASQSSTHAIGIARSQPVAPKPLDSISVKAAEPSSDGSYSFAYSTGEHAREESADANGNVRGRFSYTDDAGHHDLSYVAGDDTGFVVTGGSLSEPNGLVGKNLQEKILSKSQARTYEQPAAKAWSQDPISVAPLASFRGISHAASNQDGSAYAFSYKTDSHSREEVSDASGQVKGSYSVNADGAKQQLRFATGGSSDAGASQKWESSSKSHQSISGQSAVARSSWSTQSHGSASVDASAHPTFTVNVHDKLQKSSDGLGSAVILGYLAPQHSKKHGYIYDTKQ